MAIRFCIVEDDDVIRDGFTQILSGVSDMQCDGAFASGEAFLQQVDALQPDVVLMDIQLPGRSGIDCVQEVKLKYPKMQFLICSVFDDNENIFNALCAGATGYLLKSCDAAKLIQSVREIHNGESPMSGVIARKVIGNFQQERRAEAYFTLLSDREREILELLAKGFRYKEIATQLFLSVETVRTHIRNIYEKLQVSSRTDAINKVYLK